MYGTQTARSLCYAIRAFENDVKMYGTQTIIPFSSSPVWFENDVKMYGTQTEKAALRFSCCLRMM